MFEEFEAPITESVKSAFERYADPMLALQVCLDMEGGDIPIPAEFEKLEISERITWPPVPSDS